MNIKETKDKSTDTIQVPRYYYAVDIEYLTHMIVDMLTRLVSHNDLIPLTPSNLTRFHSRTPPNISLSDYLRRIVKYTSVEKSCLLILLIYIDHICERHPHFTVSSLTVHRFLITAIAVSSKALSDSYCTNSHYAKVGGISTQEINALELEFLRLIGWHLSSTGPTLQQYYTYLVEQHPCYRKIQTESQKEGKKRRKETKDDVARKKTDEFTRDFSDDDSTKEVNAKAEEAIYRHFDTLLEDENIPYIA